MNDQIHATTAYALQVVKEIRHWKQKTLQIEGPLWGGSLIQEQFVVHQDHNLICRACSVNAASAKGCFKSTSHQVSLLGSGAYRHPMIESVYVPSENT